MLQSIGQMFTCDPVDLFKVYQVAGFWPLPSYGRLTVRQTTEPHLSCPSSERGVFLSAAELPDWRGCDRVRFVSLKLIGARKNEKQKIVHRLAWILRSNPSAAFIGGKYQWKETLHAEMLGLSWRGYQRNRAAGKEKQSSDARPYDVEFQEAISRLSRSNCIFDSASPKWKFDSRYIKRKQRQDSASLLECSGSARC